MGFTAITTAQVDVDSPVTDELMDIVKDNFDDLNARAYSPIGIPNGDLEIDSDADGIPDGFVRALYASGSAAIEAAAPYRGAKAYKFTRALGAGNGGGYLETGYLAISEYVSPLVEFALKVSAAGIKVKVTARYFDKSKADLAADEDMYSSTSNPTSWTKLICFGVPPANARFMKVRFVGGYTDIDVAGDVWFDDLDFDPAPKEIQGNFTIAEGNNATGSYVTVGSSSVKIPKGFSVALLPLAVRAGGSSTDTQMSSTGRYAIGAVYSTELICDGCSSASGGAQPRSDGIAEIDISTLSGAQTINLQTKWLTAAVAAAYGSKTPSWATFLRR